MPEDHVSGNTKAAFTVYSITSTCGNANGLIEKNGVVTPLYRAFPRLKAECHALADALIDDTRNRPPAVLEATTEELLWGLFRARECFEQACAPGISRSDEEWHWTRGALFLNALPARVHAIGWLYGEDHGRVEDGVPMCRHQDYFPAPEWLDGAVRQIAECSLWTGGDYRFLDLALINRTAYHLSERLRPGGMPRPAGLLERVFDVGHDAGDPDHALDFLTYALERLLTACHPDNDPVRLAEVEMPSQEGFLNLDRRDGAGNPIPWETHMEDYLGRPPKRVELAPEPKIMEVD
jgi:hypothetical protein